ncbi:hypothetical protein [Vibrio sp. OPT18]|uniref:hypothetical protein n=1 Tax=Vibrio sp. OPT18 TaxID=2778641 RepID=UPI0018801923|nr:hypothetical protein [Vibrio sp. OPT18]MBE8577938.1 hypothetical protein [Vibrio sp. OPT18]
MKRNDAYLAQATSKNKELIELMSAVGAYLTLRTGKASGLEVVIVLGIVSTLLYKLSTRL